MSAFSTALRVFSVSAVEFRVRLIAALDGDVLSGFIDGSNSEKRTG